jgi:2-hydroxychromene-2-carboxylate isomerase
MSTSDSSSSSSGTTLEFFLDFMSPTAYLAHSQLPALVKRTGANVIWRPMLTLRLHEITGNRSPMAVKNKARWAMQDLARFAARYDVPLAISPHFPMKMIDALHGALVADELGGIEAYCALLFPAVWRDGIDVDDRSALARYLAAGGVDPEPIQSRIDDPAIAERLERNVQEAAERGAFGAPTFFVGDELFFGQDRLDFVEAALSR